MDWSIVDSETVEGNPVVTLELKDGPYSRSMWDFSIQALYKVSHESEIHLSLLPHFLPCLQVAKPEHCVHFL